MLCNSLTGFGRGCVIDFDCKSFSCDADHKRCLPAASSQDAGSEASGDGGTTATAAGNDGYASHCSRAACEKKRGSDWAWTCGHTELQEQDASKEEGC